MRYTPEQYMRMIPQDGVKQCFIDAPGFNAAWDYCVTPEGKHYIPCCAEGTFPEYVKLYEYLPESNTMKLCFDLEGTIVTHPRTIRPSKIHTSINPMPDGKLIMTTHTTASAPDHPCWLPEGYYTHMWEGFVGSNVLIYDPAAGKVEDLGIPVPRDTIYGAKYLPESNCLFFITYIRGHGYLFHLDDRRVEDFGQLTEFGSYYLKEASDGNIYFSTRSGDLWRFNRKTLKPEYTGVEIPREDNPSCRGRNVMTYAANGPDGKMYFVTHLGQRFFAYDPKTNTLETLCATVPEGMREDYPGGMVFGMAFDKNNILWYTCGTFGLHLCSLDILDPKAEPVDYGLIGTEKRGHCCVENIFLREDVLYMSDANHGPDAPGVVSVELETVRRNREAGILCQDVLLYLRGDAERFVPLYRGDPKADGQWILDYMAQEQRDRENIQANPFAFGGEKRYVCKIWKRLGPEGSQVEKVAFDSRGDVEAWTTGGKKVLVRDGELLSVTEEKTERKEKEERFAHVKLPAHPGRQYLAKESAWVQLADGSCLVGTRDGMLAKVTGEKVFSLGAVCNDGPVHAMAVTADGKRVYGVAGDRESLGVVFSFDLDTGVTLEGAVAFQNGDSRERTGVSCEPCCVAVSSDGKRVAIGVRDNLGCVYEFEV